MLGTPKLHIFLFLFWSIQCLLMFGQIQYFKKGELYNVINRKTQKYLTNINNHLELMPCLQDHNQLWTLNQIKNEEYELASMKSGEVATFHSKNNELAIEKGKLKINQMWKMARAIIDDQVSFYWIENCSNDNLKMFGTGFGSDCCMKAFDQTLEVSLWEFRAVQWISCKSLKKSSVIRSVFSDLVLDVPDNSKKEGTSLIHYLFHGNGNQRFAITLSQTHPYFLIMNYNSNLYLTAYNSKTSPRVTQQKLNNSLQQNWCIVKKNNKENTYLIHSAKDYKWFIVVNSEKGGSTLGLGGVGEKSLWKIEGYLPEFQ